jgi:alanyl-tRNA synthetase
MDKVPRTEKAYLQEPYTTSSRASLASCEMLADGRIVARLDSTIFYPESGGQLADHGAMGDAEVIDVWEEGDVVYHTLSQEIPSGEVNCEVNWVRRFDHMQQHTGQHVLSRAFIEIAGLKTVSFHMGDESCTIDVEGGTIDEGILEKAEDLSNAIVCENREVLVRVVPLAELGDVALRKSLPDDVDDVRLVEVSGFDVIGCCGTHVRRTGELGVIKVLKYEKAKGAHRVFFKVGNRALMDYREKHEIARRLANRFTTSVDCLEEKIDKLQGEGQGYRKSLQKMSKKLAALEARELVENARIVGGRRFIVELLAGYNEEYARQLASELKLQPNTISIVATDQGTVICNASKDIAADISTPLVERAKSVGGSGGGKGGFASVRLPDSVSVATFLEDAFSDIKNV